jgi:class 3 adenylate cyclase
MSAPRRERKVVTVVFCDLVGFTSRARRSTRGRRGVPPPVPRPRPRELERTAARSRSSSATPSWRCSGTDAHEDDPERAVARALAIRDFALEEGLELRVGITTGEALVSLDARRTPARDGLRRRRQHGGALQSAAPSTA